MIRQSLTITGLAVLILGYIFRELGVPIAEGNLETTIITLTEVIGGLAVFWGRFRQGDVSIFGKVKE